MRLPAHACTVIGSIKAEANKATLLHSPKNPPKINTGFDPVSNVDICRLHIPIREGVYKITCGFQLRNAPYNYSDYAERILMSKQETWKRLTSPMANESVSSLNPHRKYLLDS